MGRMQPSVRSSAHRCVTTTFLRGGLDGKVAMGNFADACATKYNVSREAQDTFAVNSYKKAQAATEHGWFKDEIVPVEIPQKKGAALIIDKDEEPSKVNFDKLPQLNPAFSKEGTVTAANASTMNDGAAAVVLMSAEKAKELGIQPIAIIKSFADAEQDRHQSRRLA